MNDDLDRRISEIRKKYQDYTDNNFDFSGRKNGTLTTKFTNLTS